MSAWRLLVDGAADGAWNMAVDEALLESCASGEGEPRAPTLRLYGWRPPALSLGRRQGAQGAHDPGYLRSEGIDLVRRPTGGRAVLHEHERTYAVVGRLHAAPFEGGVLDTYARIAAALVEALRALGIEAAGARAPQGVGPDPGPSDFPVCFDHVGAHEISVDGRKIVGSAQLRRRGAFLQHGSPPATVDGKAISKEKIELHMKDRLSEHKLQNASPDEKKMKAAILQELIGEQLALNEAAARGINITDAEVDKEIDMLRKKLGEEQYQKALKDRGLTPESYRNRLREKMTLTRFVEGFVKTDAITEQEMRDFYKNSPKPLMKPARVNMKVVEFQTEDAANAAVAEMKKTRADFDDYAKKLDTEE